MSIARVLVIAGSDSGGGAGIQADIRTITMLGGHPMTAVTAITAQNTLGVQAVHAVPTDMVLAQVASVAGDIGVDAVKIGMIGSAATAEAMADWIEALTSSPRPRAGVHRPAGAACGGYAEPWTQAQGRGDEGGSVALVFDPVMVATSGAVLADAATVAAFRRLMALATVVTPNLPELEGLGGEAAVRASGAAVLVKGGHAEGATVIDRLVEADGTETAWRHPRRTMRHTHGTGCTLASGIACGLAQGMTLPEATGRAIAFVQAALDAAPGIGGGHGPMGHALGRVPFDACRG